MTDAAEALKQAEAEVTAAHSGIPDDGTPVVPTSKGDTGHDSEYETAALSQCARLLDALPENAQQRVLLYLARRYDQPGNVYNARGEVIAHTRSRNPGAEIAAEVKDALRVTSGDSDER